MGFDILKIPIMLTVLAVSTEYTNLLFSVSSRHFWTCTQTFHLTFPPYYLNLLKLSLVEFETLKIPNMLTIHAVSPKYTKLVIFYIEACFGPVPKLFGQVSDRAVIEIFFSYRIDILKKFPPCQQCIKILILKYTGDC